MRYPLKHDRSTYAQIVGSVTLLSETTRRHALIAILTVLFRDGPDTEWNADTLADLGQIIDRYHLRPPPPQEEEGAP